MFDTVTPAPFATDTFDPMDGVSPWPPPPPRSPSAPARRRRGGRRLGAVLALVAATSAVGGGTAGWLAASLATPATSETATTTAEAVATSVSSTRLTDSGLDVAAVVAGVEASIVEINTVVQYRQGPMRVEGEGAGTGIVLAADGLVLTNAHVVTDASSITVRMSDGTTYLATLVRSDSAADLAVLQLDGASGLTPAVFGTSVDLAVGDDVVVIGNALDLGDTMSVSRGIVSALDRTITTDVGTLSGLVQTDAAISSGDSGGALLDASGRVVGVNSAGATDANGVSVENIGFAIPIDTALDLVAEWGIEVA
ncbi:MAG: trypsin-like peptidase domain-containing protein [Acidimicrobiales bacterium]|nr:trypsin-like peptidase domain-containing protein [Acidimicrobiales bacterium]MCB9394047.1 trypsin-like peptidase domain-containing protein [Acidimicrobiaceae bacterium]